MHTCAASGQAGGLIHRSNNTSVLIQLIAHQNPQRGAPPKRVQTLCTSVPLGLQCLGHHPTGFTESYPGALRFALVVRGRNPTPTGYNILAEPVTSTLSCQQRHIGIGAMRTSAPCHRSLGGARLLLPRPVVSIRSAPLNHSNTSIVNVTRRNTRLSKPAHPGVASADVPTTSPPEAEAWQATQEALRELPGIGPLNAAWQQVDVKQKIILACSLGFCLSNMDKTNFTVAVIPMAMTYGWTPTVSGLVQSAFFYGFLLMQLPGGYLSTRLGGAYVLPRGLALWSGATAAIPLVAGSMPALCGTRAIMGVGEAVAPSSIIDMITRTVPAKERASAVSFAFGGLHMGSIVGLLVSPVIIQVFNWPSLFLIFGGAGAAWLVWFQGIMEEVKQRDPELAQRLIHSTGSVPTSTTSSQDTSSTHMSSHGHAAPMSVDVPAPPYRAFLRNRAVRVLMFTHFCHNWFHYTMLSWLPTYFTSTLSVDLMHAAQTALLPPIVGIFASAAAGTMGDKLIDSGMPIPRVRKLAQSIGFMVPTACLALAAQSPCTPDDSTLTVACITAALGMSSFSLAGLYCSHGDLSPKYASALLGMTNVAGSLPGIIGVTTVGLLFDQTHDWSLALFLPSAALMVAGTAVYVGLGENHAIDFDSQDNSPFAVERWIKGGVSTLGIDAAWQRVTGLAGSALNRLRVKS